MWPSREIISNNNENNFKNIDDLQDLQSEEDRFVWALTVYKKPQPIRSYTVPSNGVFSVKIHEKIKKSTRLKMSNVSSPTRFTGLEDHFYDHIDISEKMRVPKRIKVSGDHDNIESVPKPSPWDEEKFDMKVPDRILVVGQDQYYGTTAPPREVILENTVMPPDPGMIRVQTPPRVITLNDHFFPSVEDDDDIISGEVLTPPNTFAEKSFNKSLLNQSKAIAPSNEWSPMPALNGAGEALQRGLAPSEEITHLRRQMAKLNRRLMAIELDNYQRQQREKYMLALGLGYFLVKFVIWLNK